MLWSCVPAVCCVVVLQQEMSDRESIMSQIAKAADELRRQGACDRWFAGADPLVKKVCILFLGCGLLLR